MRVYTVTGLVDEETGDLFVSGVFPGRHEPADSALLTEVDGRRLVRFTGYFEADHGDMAERIATEVVSHYADDDAAAWRPGSNRHRTVEDVTSDRL